MDSSREIQLYTKYFTETAEHFRRIDLCFLRDKIGSKGGDAMNYTITVDQNHDEEVLIYVHERTELVEKLEALLKESSPQLIGFQDTEFVILKEDDIFCFTITGNKVYAVTETGKYLMKRRLYQLEEILSKDFIKINQSTIANFKKIKKFDSTIGGSLKVVFKNGYADYVSRRNIKQVKERLGI